MRYVFLVVLGLVLSGCPGKQPGSNASKPPSNTKPLTVCLLRTDLGLGDGLLVRDADKALNQLEMDGQIQYEPVGNLPFQLESEGGTGDVGLPGAEVPPGGKPSGLMTADEAGELAEQIPDSDVVIVSGPVAAKPVLARIEAGTLKVGAVFLLDDEGPKLATPHVNLISINYDLTEAAYLLGVAAGVSSRSQAFVAITSSQDPSADIFLKCFTNGVRNRMRGGNVYSAQITPDADNIVSAKDFDNALGPLVNAGVKVDHFIIVAGRATPSIMYALSSNPYKGYLLGGYGDFRQVRPARIVGCIVKHPGVALQKLFDGAKSLSEVHERAVNGKLTVGFREGGVDVTDLDAYAHYNKDAENIADAVVQVRSEILGGELDVMQ